MSNPGSWVVKTLFAACAFVRFFGRFQRVGKDRRGYVKVSGITNVPFVLQIVFRYLWGVSQQGEEWFNSTLIHFTYNLPHVKEWLL